MELKRNGTLGNLYWFTYQEMPPDDLCRFFWKELVAAGLFPLTWVSFLCNPVDFGERILATFIAWFVLAAVGLYGLAWFNRPWMTLAVTGCVIGVILFFGVLGALAEVPEIFEWVRETEVVQMIAERKRGFKEKYCPRIDWK